MSRRSGSTCTGAANISRGVEVKQQSFTSGPLDLNRTGDECVIGLSTVDAQSLLETIRSGGRSLSGDSYHSVFVVVQQ